VDFMPSERARTLAGRLKTFLTERVVPAEPLAEAQLAELGDPHGHPPVLEELKAEARELGLWNLFLPHSTRFGEGLSNVDYAPLAELMGRSPLAPEACNCSAPDTGNMEILALHGTPAQQERWLAPLLEGEIRSCFAMTEPEVASSDATNIACRIRTDGDELVVDGHKWWTTGAASSRCRVAIVMGVTNPDAPPHRRHSMVLVPMDAPGVEVVRALPVFGYQDRDGHAEVRFEQVRVPRTNLLGGEGEGFAIAQARLGPGRIHHCMRALGMAERALELLCARADERFAFGRPLADHDLLRAQVAESRLALDQARLLTLWTAWRMDTAGTKAARIEISAIKVAVMRAALEVVDRAIQAHGGMGVSADTPLARTWAGLRTLRIADGPDEVHLLSVARRELARQRANREAGHFGRSVEEGLTIEP
jgi:acyl-CoA dehydrogenase